MTGPQKRPDPSEDWVQVPEPPVWAMEQARAELGERPWRTLSLRAWQIALERDGVHRPDDSWRLSQPAVESQDRQVEEEDRWWLARLLDGW